MASFVDKLHPLVLNIGLAIHNADWNWKNVNSPFTRLYYVTEGTAQVLISGKTQILKANHMYFIPAFTKHSYICNSYFSHYYLHIYEEHQSDSNLLDNWDFPIEIPAVEIDLALFQRLCTINPHMTLQKSDPTSYDNNYTLMQNLLKNKQRTLSDKIESRGIVYQLLARFLKRAQVKMELKDNRIEEAIHYIRKHINETIDLRVLAENSCLSKDHFIRLFKKETGDTPLKYINRKKIEKAQLILITDDMSIKNVALNLAFEDYSYFNRLFKKITLPKNIAPLITLKQKKRNSNFHTIPFFSTRSKRLRYPQLIFIQIKHTFHQLPFFSRRTQTRTVLKFRHILFPLSLPRKIRQFIHSYLPIKVQWSFYNHKKL